MRNLDAINPTFLKSSRLCIASTGVLFIQVLLCTPLASQVAPHVSLLSNPLIVLMNALCAVFLIVALLSIILQWGWETNRYGIFLLPIASVSFLALIPCSAVIVYGIAPLWVKAGIAGFYVVTHIRWCRKFSFLYRRICKDEQLRTILFEEETDAVYYMRKGDNFLLEKTFKFGQVPSDSFFLLFMILAFSLIPVMRPVSAFFGTPFVHVFMMIAMLPVSWMSIGLACRAYLVFFAYPAQIKKLTGKRVYVDLEGKRRSALAQRVKKS